METQEKEFKQTIVERDGIKTVYTQLPSCSVFHFDGGGTLSPSMMESFVEIVQESKPPLTKGVVLSGRLPVWVFGSLIHELHPAAWVGTFDPRTGGAVVVQAHTRGVVRGQIIQIPAEATNFAE